MLSDGSRQFDVAFDSEVHVSLTSFAYHLAPGRVYYGEEEKPEVGDNVLVTAYITRII